MLTYVHLVFKERSTHFNPYLGKLLQYRSRSAWRSKGED